MMRESIPGPPPKPSPLPRGEKPSKKSPGKMGRWGLWAILGLGSVSVGATTAGVKNILENSGGSSSAADFRKRMADRKGEPTVIVVDKHAADPRDGVSASTSKKETMDETDKGDSRTQEGEIDTNSPEIAAGAEAIIEKDLRTKTRFEKDDAGTIIGVTAPDIYYQSGADTHQAEHFFAADWREQVTAEDLGLIQEHIKQLDRDIRIYKIWADDGKLNSPEAAFLEQDVKKILESIEQRRGSATIFRDGALPFFGRENTDQD